MKLYSKAKDYELYNGNMLDMLEVVEKESVDSIVCDPPYGLTSITKRFGKETSAPCQFGTDGAFSRLSKGFMGKEWDGTGIEYNIEAWQKCYEVLKPGGYLLAFGGSRTFHRIACAIEDAGFEIRDTIMWLYGCLSNDTEILTSNGWKNSETIKENDFIYSLDLQGNKLLKNKVKNVFKYDYDGEMVHLENENTDQLITPNHHCIIKDTIRTRIKKNANYNKYDYWYYTDAWRLRSQTFELPLSSNYDGTLEIGNLFAELLGWVISEGTYLKDTNAIMITQSDVNKEYIKRIKYIFGKLNIKYSEYTREREYKEKKYIEYDFYIGKESTDVVDKIKKLCPEKRLNWNLLELSLSNKEFLIKGLLKGDGTKDTKSKIGFSAFNQYDLEQLTVFQALLHLTNKQGWINEGKMYCSIHCNNKTQLQGKHNKDRLVNYNGKYVWCIETEVGNFVARRNGKIFITGNSGFPKSMNVGLAIDKKNGAESKIIGRSKNKIHLENLGKAGFKEEWDIKQAQNEWAGWGTSLKPSYEPIIVARKPFKGSLVDNVIKYGVGGINIDECRVKTDELKGKVYNNSGDNLSWGGTYGKGIAYGNEIGRFPANVILTYDESDKEEVCGGMPDTKSNGSSANYEKSNNDNVTHLYTNIKSGNHFDDEGSASRYFYCAKASKKDRDEGLDEFEEKYILKNNIDEKTKQEIKRLLNL